ncbi:hypothetical protein [Oceanospirillum beijerinckii]|uniref:hypothetical protein n=1 Tax=Oceanospirillum beijerinckii TaxID=64976 RepID=UPI0004094A16|nr:hypothetical protein [Oceanospirillum beijerinckii]MAC45811.1 hypothetical protein [Oceanospirillum sp.]
MKKHAVNRIMGKAIATYACGERQQDILYTAYDTHDDVQKHSSLIRQLFSSQPPTKQNNELFYLQIDS